MSLPSPNDASMNIELNGVREDGELKPWAVVIPIITNESLERCQIAAAQRHEREEA